MWRVLSHFYLAIPWEISSVFKLSFYKWGNLTQSHTPNCPVELGFDYRHLAPHPMHLTSKPSKPTVYDDILNPGPTGWVLYICANVSSRWQHEDRALTGRSLNSALHYCSTMPSSRSKPGSSASVRIKSLQWPCKSIPGPLENNVPHFWPSNPTHGNLLQGNYSKQKALFWIICIQKGIHPALYITAKNGSNINIPL